MKNNTYKPSNKPKTPEGYHRGTGWNGVNIFIKNPAKAPDPQKSKKVA